MNNKVILVDADGVLLDWIYAFDQWMSRHGFSIVEEHKYSVYDRYGMDKEEGRKYCRIFNESSSIRKIPPLRDAIHYVKKLHELHGYVFHVISSLSDDEYSQHLRTKNLRELFGDTVFERYIYLDTGADKDGALSKYKDTNCWWIEDKYENYIAGEEVGLEPLLMKHEHNNHHTDVRFVNNWKDIYDIIVGDVMFIV